MFKRFLPLKPNCIHDVMSNVEFDGPAPTGYSVSSKGHNAVPSGPLANHGWLWVARRMVGEVAQVEKGFHYYEMGKFKDATTGKLTLIKGENPFDPDSKTSFFYTVPDALLEIEKQPELLTVVASGLHQYLKGHDQVASDHIAERIGWNEKAADYRRWQATLEVPNTPVAE